MRLRPFILVFTVLLFPFCNQTKIEEIVLPDNISWSEHIAPIIFKNCTPCHRPGEAGTFDLLNYTDAVKNANKIKFVTQTKFMPPWPADPDYVHFADEKVLNETEIELIKKWADEVYHSWSSSHSLVSQIADGFLDNSYYRKTEGRITTNR